MRSATHVVSSFVSMCGRCHYCQTGRPQFCVQSLKALYTLPDGTVRTRDAAGSALNVFCGCGVMAEFATLHSDNLVKIDKQMPLDRAALIGCGVMTGVGAAVNTARVEAGSMAVVFGCGGVGLNAIQGCAIAGAGMIVAVDTSEPKLELARKFGATHVFNVSGQDNVGKSLYKLTGGGADYAFDCVGLGKISEQAWGVLRRGGTAVIVGIAGPKDEITLNAQQVAHQREDLDRQLLWIGAAATGFSAPHRPVPRRPTEARRIDHAHLFHRRGAPGVRRPRRGPRRPRRDHLRRGLKPGAA